MSSTTSSASPRLMMSRRLFVAGAPLALAGCVTQGPGPEPTGPVYDQSYLTMYGPKPDERFPLPAIDISQFDPMYLRQVVSYNGPERPGTIVVDPNNKFLYLVRDDGRAMRYGVGVGRQGLEWSGRAVIRRKAEWPTWTPTADMIRRDPEKNAPWAGGMPPGLQNPLGARAMYLYQGDRDTMYRLHGTNEPYSIGTAVSSGCIRLLNQDIVDLYSRVPTGTPVVVIG